MVDLALYEMYNASSKEIFKDRFKGMKNITNKKTFRIYHGEMYHETVDYCFADIVKVYVL